MLDRKEEKRREHRRKKYKFALVKRWHWAKDAGDVYTVERKVDLMWMSSYRGQFEVICDWEPERVLRGMLKLLRENGDE